MKYVIIADLTVMPAFIATETGSDGVRKYNTFGIADEIVKECLYDRDEAEKFAAELRGPDEEVPVYVIPEHEGMDRFDVMRMEIALTGEK